MIASKPGCPSAEELAAYLDGRLAAERASAVATHALGCEECSEVVEGVVSARIAGVLDAPKKHTLAHVRWVASAAAVILAGVLGWWLIPERSGDRNAIAELVEASRGHRFVEVRLMGGFEPGPVTRGSATGPADSDRWRVTAVAQELKERFPDQPSAADAHAFGVAHLLLGSSDEAIPFLEDAVADAPKEAGYKADLAGGLLQRARTQSRPEDAVRALSIVEEALAIKPNLPEALFNKALALETMQLAEPAQQAWEAYLAADPGSDWAAEARAHADRLKARPNPPKT